MLREMTFAAASTTLSQAEQATEDLVSQAKAILGEVAPDILIVFLSPHFTAAVDKIRQSLQDTLAPTHLLGCTGEYIIGQQAEFEDTPAISLLAGVLPQVTVSGFHLERQNFQPNLSD